MSLRRATVSLVLLLGLALLAGRALAGDEPPPFGASDLAIEEEGIETPWEQTWDEVEGTPGDALETWVEQTAAGAGVDDGDLLFETRVLRNKEDGTGATLTMVEVDGDPKNLRQTLAAKGQPLGYVVKEFGHPTRLLVLAAPKEHQKALLDMQMAYSIQTIARLAWERLESGSRVGALEMAQAGRALDPKAAPPLVVLGMAATKQEEFDEAIQLFREAFGKGVTVPAKGRLAMRGYAHYGYACLQKKDPAMDREGRDAFKKCVALESTAAKEDPLYIQRYNLACAHSRLNETADALQELKKALELARVQFGANLAAWIDNHVRKDDDLANIRNLDAFKAIIDRAKEGGRGTNPLEGFYQLRPFR